jgi:hypothetical protein
LAEANRIGRGRHRLTRRQRAERAAAVGAHGDFQPAVRAGELIPEIQRHGEQAVAYPCSGVRYNGANLIPSPCRIEQRKAKVIQAAGHVGAIIQPALIGEGRALGADGVWSVEGGERQER